MPRTPTPPNSVWRRRSQDPLLPRGSTEQRERMNTRTSCTFVYVHAHRLYGQHGRSADPWQRWRRWLLSRQRAAAAAAARAAVEHSGAAAREAEGPALAGLVAQAGANRGWQPQGQYAGGAAAAGAVPGCKLAAAALTRPSLRDVAGLPKGPAGGSRTHAAGGLVLGGNRGSGEGWGERGRGPGAAARQRALHAPQMTSLYFDDTDLDLDTVDATSASLLGGQRWVHKASVGRQQGHVGRTGSPQSGGAAALVQGGS